MKEVIDNISDAEWNKIEQGIKAWFNARENRAKRKETIIDKIAYSRAIELLSNTINYTLQDREIDIAKEDLKYIGFSDEELCALGFEDVFFMEEEI